MTTFGEARTELLTALTVAGCNAVADPGADAPYVLVQFDGGNAAHLLRGAVQADYRLTLVGGGWDQRGSAAELDALRQTVIATLRDLAGWQVGDIGRDGGRDWAGGTYLCADVGASRQIDL